MTRETLEAYLLRLPTEDRAHLARVLIESLEDQPELDPLWLDEAELRALELRAGNVKPVPAVEVIERARRRLAE